MAIPYKTLGFAPIWKVSRCGEPLLELGEKPV